MSVRLASLGHAVPGTVIEQSAAAEFVQARYRGRLSPGSLRLAGRVFSHPSVRRRHFAFDDPSCLIDEDPDRRVERFTRGALALSAEAARGAMERAGVAARDVKGIVVNTCTGYLCPGISTYLIELLGLGRDVRAYDLVGSGCGGAVPNLQVCSLLLKEAPGGAVLGVSVEICSGTFQMGDDPGLIVSNALFADGAAAALVWDRPQGLEVVDTASLFLPEHREHIRFVYRNGQLHNRLSRELPGLVGKVAGELAGSLLAKHGLDHGMVRHWAVHPGGSLVIDAVREAAGLTEEKLRHSRAVLAGYGNMSSATAWFVLQRILDEGVSPGEWCVMLAFGAGMSVHASLLRA